MTGPAAVPKLSLSVLGGLRLSSTEAPLGSAAKQPRRLIIAALAALAGPEGISRERLLGLLWPEQDDASARNALKQALHALRRDTVRDLFLEGATVRLNSATIDADLWRFERAVSAGDWAGPVAAYGGPLLAGVGSLGSAELEHWIDIERDRLAGRFAAAVESAAAAAPGTSVALEFWYKLAAIDPMNDRAAQAIARGLAESGNRSAALRHAESHITRVREELDLPPDAALAALLEEIGKPSEAVTVAALGSVAPPALPAGPSREVPRLRRMRRRHWAIAAAVPIAAVLLFVSEDAATTGGDEGPPTLAVLPFENRAAAPADDYFADGLTDEITDRLSAISGLRVISRRSASQYKKSSKNLAQIGAELGAGYLLDGTVRWQRDPDGSVRVRITPRLVRARDQAQLWSGTHEAPLGNVFEAQSAIATRVAEELQVSLLAPERNRVAGRATPNAAAHDFYLRAKAALYQSRSERDLLLAAELYRRATRLDSTFAEAWAGQSLADGELYWSYYDRTLERLQDVRAAAERAVRLDPDSWMSHLALGYYHYYGFLNYERALAEFEIARRLSPSNGDVLEAMAYVLRRQGKWNEAVTHLEQALRVDPRSLAKARVLGETYVKLARYGDARRALRRALDIDSTDALPYVGLAVVQLNELGDLAGARAEVRRGLRAAGLVGMVLASQHYNSIPLRTVPQEFEEAFRAVAADAFGPQRDLYHISRGTLCSAVAGAAAPRCRAHYDSARAILEPMASARGDILARYHSYLAIAYAGLGREPDAVRQGRMAVQMLPISRDASNGPNIVVHFAQAAALVGADSLAASQLKSLNSVPSFFNPRQLSLDPLWSGVRRHW